MYVFVQKYEDFFKTFPLTIERVTKQTTIIEDLIFSGDDLKGAFMMPTQFAKT